ncbi:hypothetical protein LXM94_25515 [Rhizobium sp. TRM95111]|uniref:hypothetical protein n=1 Tax=Rhizobium alarense TaxID=2846851 RepID=UPI001F23269F|nr:hypothetical protein [Rhizobium alarense]MCF3643316.1 hypothetical protein [Rhizobium alarense]
MNIEARQRIERRIAKAAIGGLLDAGFFLSVYDGEEFALRRSRDAKAIAAVMGATDEESLLAYRPNPATDAAPRWQRVGSVLFVYGNDGWDVIADYSTSLEPHLQRADELADQLERLHA